MKNTNKLITYGIRIGVVGLTILIISLIAIGFDYRKISGIIPKKEDNTKTYSIYDVKNINVNINQTDINIGQGEDKLIKISMDSVGKNYTSELKNGVLNISVQNNNPQLEIDSEKDYLDLNIPLGYEGKIDIYVNQGDINYKGESLSENVKIFTTNGNININNSNFRKNIELKNSNGLISIEDSSCQNIDIISNLGNIDIDRIDAKENIKIQGNSGNFTLNSLMANRSTIDINLGYIDIKNTSTLENLTINSNKADLSLQNTNVGSKLKVSSTDGSQNYKDIQGKIIDLSSTEGDIEGIFLGSNDIYNLNIRTNGNVQAPKTAGYQEFNVNSNKGDVKIQIENDI